MEVNGGVRCMKIDSAGYSTVVDTPKDITAFKEIVNSNSVIIAGGTLLQINWEAGGEKPSNLISVEHIPTLQRIEEVEIGSKRYLQIGACVTIAECLRNNAIKTFTPILAEACLKIAAPAVRNRGTIGGNVCSKVGDTIPALLTLDAILQFQDGAQNYSFPLVDWLKQPSNRTPELLTNILIPIDLTSKNKVTFFQKVGRRESFTAAIISIAGYVEYKDNLVQQVRLAIGGGAHQPCRLLQVEKELSQKAIDNNDWLTIHKSIMEGFSSYTDPFVTAEYRKKVAANLFVANLRKRINK